METEKKKSGGWDLSTPDLQPVLVQRQCLSAGGVSQPAGEAPEHFLLLLLPRQESECEPGGGGWGGDQSGQCGHGRTGGRRDQPQAGRQPRRVRLALPPRHQPRPEAQPGEAGKA